MLDVNKPINKFKEEVIRLASDSSFIHHRWYVKYHLEIVEKLALELCEIYTIAKQDLVVTLVWLHDYGKIISQSSAATLTKGKEHLLRLGFHFSFVDLAIQYAEMVDRKEALHKAPIEVKIISSADGASHLVGPFQFLWWYENNTRSMETLLNDNIKKIEKDWQKKIVLPEVRRSFQQRRDFMLELSGRLPSRLLRESED